MRLLYMGVLMLACWTAGAQETPGLSLEKEAALGRQLAAAFRREYPALESAAVQAYVERTGVRIAAQLQGARAPFTFGVTVGDRCRTIHEPAALPGGYVFVPAALFLAAQDEAEFAGVLAHAMEHVARRHGTRQAVRGETINVASAPLVFIGGMAGGCWDGLAIPMGFLEMQRANELEADDGAIRAMARAGFDPAALARYIDRVQVPPAGTLGKMFSGTPEREERLARMRRLIEELPATEYAVGGEEFAAVQAEVRRLVERPPDLNPPTLKRKGERE